MAERFIAPVLKTGEVSKTSVGSNPTPSATGTRAARAGAAQVVVTKTGIPAWPI